MEIDEPNPTLMARSSSPPVTPFSVPKAIVPTNESIMSSPLSAPILIHDQTHDDDDMEDLYWNPPPGFVPPPSLLERSPPDRARSSTIETTSRSSEQIPDTRPQLEVEPQLVLDAPIVPVEPAADAIRREPEQLHKLLTKFIHQRHPDEENPWSPFLGIKCSHQIKRGARRKGKAALLDQRNGTRGHLNFNLEDWVEQRHKPG